MTSGLDLKLARVAAQVEQGEIARELGVTRQVVGQWEAQEQPTPEACRRHLEAVAKIAAAPRELRRSKYRSKNRLVRPGQAPPKLAGPVQPLLTMLETSRLLHISRSKVYELAREGKLPGVIYVGNSIRVNRAKLEAWIDEASAWPHP